MLMTSHPAIPRPCRQIRWNVTFAHTANDLTTEGTEKIAIKLFSDWKRESQVGETAVSVNDTSLSPEKAVFTIDGTNVWEGDTAQVPITRKGNTSAAVDLTVNTVNGTASSGSDYTAQDKTIRFAVGTRSKKISINTKKTPLLNLMRPSRSNSHLMTTSLSSIINLPPSPLRTTIKPSSTKQPTQPISPIIQPILPTSTTTQRPSLTPMPEPCW